MWPQPPAGTGAGAVAYGAGHADSGRPGVAGPDTSASDGAGFVGGPPTPRAEAATELLAAVPAGPPAAPEPHTPAYGIPVPAPAEQTMQLSPVAPHPRRAGSARRNRLLVPLIAGGGVLAVGAVALSLGVFTGSGKGDAVLLDPGPSAPAISVAPVGPSDGPTGETPSPSASASPSTSTSASRSASPSASAASPTASRSSSAAPAPSATTGRPVAPTTPSPAAKPVTLRSGDSGPEVEKLQRLLADQGLYRGRFDGRYGRSVERAVDDFQFYNDVRGDPSGVYGPATRRALEG
ncbi:peptidoglycan-binding domain-containing protein [Streptomyces sp. NPDC004667]|uniref:peptidoglycan-binding domain-containing protein n=1 Tax=Streptomyces sp. NPDC004667 TaxID=3154285 RepID=UPI0033BD5F6A